MAREDWLTLSYAEAKKLKSLAIHTDGYLKGLLLSIKRLT